MAWVGVITNAGASAITACAEGMLLNINSVKTGSGYYDTEIAMRGATDVKVPKDVGAVIEKKATTDSETGDAGVMVRVSISAAETSYDLTEVGLFGRLGDQSSGTDVMIAYYKNTSGVNIPAAENFPDFNLTLSAFIAIDNTETLTITTDPDAMVSQSQAEEMLEDKVDVHQGSEKAGYFMMVNEDGDVEATEIPLASGGGY